MGVPRPMGGETPTVAKIAPAPSAKRSASDRLALLGAMAPRFAFVLCLAVLRVVTAQNPCIANPNTCVS